MPKKVLVAMSGGVDSSVAALLLKKEGYHVAGVTMCLGIAAEEDSARCCGADAIDDARRVCDQLSIAHYVLDYADQLEEKVIAKFISEYQQGRTPNPCVDCNRHLKFSSLLNKTLGLGFDYLATGHYAAIERKDDRYLLKRPKDRKKDQTYFLYAIPYGKLEHILFPLASLTKEEVKDIAKKEALPVAEKPESQDICFVTQKNYQEFILKRAGAQLPGPIVDRQGKVLGRHRGIVFHTVGQRGGLGISHPTPLYVLSIDPIRNRIVVGEKKELLARGLFADDVNLLAQTWPDEVQAKIRYRKKEALCKVTAASGRLKVIFSEDQEAITPGQSVVFYDDDCVLGGGEIQEVFHGTD
ncbi:MAG TPA: tRNA 2-thiouridine(34) synthase MnmA [Smithellaceae bacterium]|jgi:tRNA-uridine 2-sulfurtransferase|nr:tRNA 2-thiouridine(34) synthase MnmA [Smithellaceae bacterium]HQM45867.1 tRNA 2-thiouridine(34) synthase MnmA [Smithellaceae bacterium]